MNPKIVSREVIKPFSSTPNIHPKIHKLSFFDHIEPPIYIPLLYFYSSKDGETENHRSSVVKSSLAAALSRYYPLAGRTKDEVTIDCSDEGVVFLEARMECKLSEILKNPNDETLKPLLCDRLCYKLSALSSPVVVQATYFQCGGMSLGLCLCHKIVDMASMCSFVNEWASLARNPSEKIFPSFTIGSLYPPLDLSFPPPPQGTEIYASKRLVFDPEKISQLKKIVEDRVLSPTRVEVVTSLLYQSAISALVKSSLGSVKSTVLYQVMNLRARVFPPLSERLTGNLLGFFPISVNTTKDVDLGWLVKEFRREKTWFSGSCSKACNEEELCLFVLENVKALKGGFGEGEEVLLCSSWCKFPLYEADFGWGKPLLVTTVCWPRKNHITLMDTKEGDGIEAFITLEEEAMALFELDQQIISFSTIT